MPQCTIVSTWLAQLLEAVGRIVEDVQQLDALHLVTVAGMGPGHVDQAQVEPLPERGQQLPRDVAGSAGHQDSSSVAHRPSLPTCVAAAARGKDPAMSAQDWVPEHADVAALRQAAADCQGCELYGPATQTVFSGGSSAASMMLVGEQPGDVEDREGLPFVGPAGRLLQRAVDEAGIDRSVLYVTNAVKHFRFEQRGKRRIHQTPQVRHIKACRPWLSAEIAAVRPG